MEHSTLGLQLYIGVFYAVLLLSILFSLCALNISLQPPFQGGTIKKDSKYYRRSLWYASSSTLLPKMGKWKYFPLSYTNELQKMPWKKFKIRKLLLPFRQRAGNLALPLVSSTKKLFNMFRDLRGHHKYETAQYIRKVLNLQKVITWLQWNLFQIPILCLFITNIFLPN